MSSTFTKNSCDIFDFREEKEVAIFYFRSGFRPGNFPTEQVQRIKKQPILV